MQKTLVGMCLVGLLMVGGCSSKSDDSGAADPVSACKSFAGAICSKVFGCFSKDQQALLVDEFGNNQSDCNTKLSANCTTEMTKCDSGTSYDSANASECLHQVQSLSCAEFMDPNTATLAVCADDKICH